MVLVDADRSPDLLLQPDRGFRDSDLDDGRPPLRFDPFPARLFEGRVRHRERQRRAHDGRAVLARQVDTLGQALQSEQDGSLAPVDGCPMPGSTSSQRQPLGNRAVRFELSVRLRKT